MIVWRWCWLGSWVVEGRGEMLGPVVWVLDRGGFSKSRSRFVYVRVSVVASCSSST